MREAGHHPPGVEPAGPAAAEPSIVARDFAHETGLLTLLAELKRLPADFFSLKIVESREQQAELTRLLRSAEAYHAAIEERRLELLGRRQKEPSPEQLLVEQLYRLSSRLWDAVASFHDFTSRLASRDTLDPVQRGLLTAAVRSVSRTLGETVEAVQNFPVEGQAKTSRYLELLKNLLLAAGSVAGVLTAGALKDTAETAVYEPPAITYLTEYPPETNPADSDNSQPDPDAAAETAAPDSGGNNNPYGTDRTPDMRDLGPNTPDQEFADIDFSWPNNIDDPLWVRYLSARFPDGKFRAAGQELVDADTTIEATVRTRPRAVRAGTKIELPAPLGFALGKVTADPSASFSVDNDERTITFAEAAEGVAVTYTVVASRDNYRLPPVTELNLNRTGDQWPVIERLRAADDEDIAEILDDHLAKFIYLTSDDIQELVGAMPGTLEEKVGALKVGDCDMLAAYAAGLLNDAGRPAFVANGLLETDGALTKARAHAKLVYLAAGRPVLYETTAPVEAVYRDVKLNPDDRAQLARVAGDIDSASAVRRLEGYANFRRALLEILDKSEYDQYDDAGWWEEIKNFFTQLFSSKKGKGILESEGTKGLFISLSIVLAGLLAIFGPVEALKFSARRTRRKGDREAAARLRQYLETVSEPISDSPQESTPAAKGRERWTKGTFNRRLRQLFEEEPRLAELIPPESIESLPLRTQQYVFTFLHVYLFVFPHRWNEATEFFTQFSSQALWSKLIARLEAEGSDAQDVIRAVRELITDPAHQKKALEDVPSSAQYIVDRGKQLAASNYVRITPDKKRRPSETLRLLGIELSADGERAARRLPRVEKGFDVHDYVPYQPGMDARLINWPVYARTGKLEVQRSVPETKPPRPETTFSLAIDVVGCQDPYTYTDGLPRLVALLMYAQEHPDKISIERVLFVAWGETVATMDESVTKKLLSRREGLSAIRYLTEKILKLGIEHDICPSLAKNRNAKNPGSMHNTFSSSIGYALPPELPPDKNYLYIGGHAGGNRQLRHITQLYKFTAPGKIGKP